MPTKTKKKAKSKPRNRIAESSGVESVTLSAGGKSVTMTAEQFSELPNKIAESNGHAPADPTGTPSQLADWKARIEAQEAECARCEYEYISAKEEAKERKAAFDGAVATLRQLIRRANDPQRELPFDAEAGESHVIESDWRFTSLEALGIKPGIAKALNENGVENLGGIADYSEANGNLTGLNGVGPAAVDAIATAVERFWREHPQEPDEGATEFSDQDHGDSEEN